MSRRHWFLPDVPDVLGLLRRQVALTVQGMDAFAAWAATGGDAQAAATVRALEHEADAAKRELRSRTDHAPASASDFALHGCDLSLRSALVATAPG